ncbi:MAG: sulfatase-like hydrolase/transferase [Planctomycetota bacterium]|nr:sulfatase-like hydrolase/transferase [Planctomycetota bacterium]
MKTYFLFCLTLILHFSAFTNQVASEDSRPNVIFIYADDQGSFDLNCYGSKDLITPNLDNLAETGVRFTTMYSPSAICSASRAGLLTGLYPARAGVPGNVSSKQGVAGMATEQVTIAEHLKANGYRTGHVGKWHLGYTPETMPNGQGFDDSFGHMGGCIDNYSHFFYWNGPNRHDLWKNGKEIFRDGEYFGDLMVNQCNSFIEEHQKKPFFLYWAINWPHYPLQGTNKWREKYKNLPHPRNKYATFVSTMDELIGQVISNLETLGLRQNTIILFQSDHGHSVEERAFFGGGNPGPFRGAKGCLFEGGIRVPSIISWPNSIPKGQVRQQMVCGIDWVPTILDFTKSKMVESSEPFDGKSIAATIRTNADSPHEYLYWLLGRGKNAQWAIRKNQWKLLGNPRDVRNLQSVGKSDKLFLVDLENDLSEKNNLADSQQPVMNQLMKLQQAVRNTIDLN